MTVMGSLKSPLCCQQSCEVVPTASFGRSRLSSPNFAQSFSFATTLLDLLFPYLTKSPFWAVILAKHQPAAKWHPTFVPC